MGVQNERCDLKLRVLKMNRMTYYTMIDLKTQKTHKQGQTFSVLLTHSLECHRIGNVKI